MILWTPQEQTEFGKIKNGWSVDGLITDRPTDLRKWIEDYKSIETQYTTAQYSGVYTTATQNELTIYILKG